MPAITPFLITKTDSGFEFSLYEEPKSRTLILAFVGVSLLAPKFAPFAYEYHYMQVLYGSQKPDYNIFEHIHDYKTCLVKYGLNRKIDDKKTWYHVLTGIYFLDNGEYSLTEEQTININLCHDKQMTAEIYQHIQERLVTYSKEAK